MKKISGIGLVKFQQDQKEEQIEKMIQKEQMLATNKIVKSMKEKDDLIMHLFNTVNKLTKEIKQLKEEK